jgi:hypothetical protein
MHTQRVCACTSLASASACCSESTLTRGTRLAQTQRLIDQRKLRGKAHARAIARVNAKRLGRQPLARDKPKDYLLADE